MPEPPTIIQLADSISRRNGGIAESLLGLTESIGAREEFSMRIFCGEDDRYETDRTRFRACTTTAFPLQGVGPATCMPGLARVLREARPDILHLHGLWGPAGRTLARLHLPGPPRILISPHGMLEDWAMRRSRLKKRLSRLVWEGSLLHSATSFHALSRFEAKTMRKWIGTTPVAVLPNGIDLPDVPPPPTPEGHLLFLGRIHPMKGLDSLLRAWALCRSESFFPTTRLVIAGWDEGGYADHLISLARSLELRLPSEVAFPGPAFGEDKERWLAGAAAFLLPSHNEGLPMTILESWARSRPTLMTDACHLPAGFERNAALRITTSPEEIARQIARFLKLPPSDRIAMGAAGRQLVGEQFAWRVVGKGYAQLYQDLLETGSPHRSLVTP